MHIGLKIKTLVDTKKVTAIELSKVLGKSRQTVYNLFNDEDVSTEVIKKINQQLGIPFTYFFEDNIDAMIVKEDQVQLFQTKHHGSSDDEFWKEQIKLKDQLLLEEKERVKEERERLKKCQQELARFKNDRDDLYDQKLTS